MTSCLILGGGINGLHSALSLRQAGLDVCVLDQGAVGQESSWAGAGILSLLLPWSYGPAVTELALRGRALWPALAKHLHSTSGIDPEYLACGMVVLDVEAREVVLEWCANHGELVAPLPTFPSHDKHINAPMPSAGTAVCETSSKKFRYSFEVDTDSALWLPNVAQVRNPRVMQAMRAAALRSGITILEQTPALRLLTQGSRVTGVETPNGTLAADIVLVTAGAWTRDLLSELIETPEVFPVRGQIMLFRAEPGLLPCVVYRRGHYLVPRADGCILAGSTLEDVGFDKSTTRHARDELLDFAYSVMPSLRGAEIVTQWAGLRPGSPGNVPTIDRHPSLENLYVNSGHFRYGVTMAPAAGEVLLHRMLGTATAIDAAPYSWKSCLHTSPSRLDRV